MDILQTISVIIPDVPDQLRIEGKSYERVGVENFSDEELAKITAEWGVALVNKAAELTAKAAARKKEEDDDETL